MQPPAARILVAYYPDEGLVRECALQIARRCHADLQPIAVRSERVGRWGALLTALKARLGILPELQRPRRTAGDYDLVVLGSTSTAAGVAPPMAAYLSAYGRQMARVAFFCVGPRRAHARTFDAMRARCGQRPLAKLSIPDRPGDLSVNAHSEPLRRFVAGLNAIDPGRPGAAERTRATEPATEFGDTEGQRWPLAERTAGRAAEPLRQDERRAGPRAGPPEVSR